MQARWPQGALATEATRRLAWALALSIALHALVIASLQGGLPQQSARAATAIEARIEPAAAPQAHSLAQTTETPEPARYDPAAAAAEPAAAETFGSRRLPTSTPPAPGEAASPQATEATAAAFAAARDPVYHVITALDRPPAPLVRPDGCYPDGARGEVAYELLIDENGVVDKAVVLSVQPLELFTADAEKLCAAVRFAPAIKDGRAVKSKVRFVLGRADAVSPRE
jgi:outer membrane biosynthesis protein TonB